MAEAFRVTNLLRGADSRPAKITSSGTRVAHTSLRRSVMRPLHLLLLLVTALSFAGCQKPASPEPESASATLEFNGELLPISGPYSHENLTVFLIHAGNQDERDFITLDEGLKQNLVAVTEKEQEQVR